MPDKDYILWTTSPGGFFREKQSFFLRVIQKKCFSGHHRKQQHKAWLKSIETAMKHPDVVLELKKYKGHSRFIGFYTAVLKDKTTTLCQQDDELLLDTDYPKLLAKYRPLIKFVAEKHLSGFKNYQAFHDDLIQQVCMNILSKKDTIVNSYSRKYLFRNYMWTCAKHESINVLTALIKKAERDSPEESAWFEAIRGEDNMSNLFIVEEALRIFDQLIGTYLNRKVKLLICLCIILNLKISKKLTGLIEEQIDIFDFEANNTSNNSSIGNISEVRIITRFEEYNKVLNDLDGTKTSGESYWRWTNMQIGSLIEALNEEYYMSFNRHTFKILAEKYFYKYFNDEFPK